MVTLAAALPVLFHDLRVLLAILLDVAGVGFPPAGLTVPAELVIDRILLFLIPVVVVGALALTGRLTANPLVRTESGRLKPLLAIRTTDCFRLHHGFRTANGIR